MINDEGFPDNPGYVSEAVWKAIEAAMQPRRKDRPQSIAEFLKILDGNDNAGTDDDKTIYEDADTHIDDDKTAFEEDSTQITTRLDVDTTPPDANVILDGKSLDKTPVKGYEVTTGQHELRIEKSGYEPYNTRMTFGSEPVKINETHKKEAAQRPKPSWLKWSFSAAAGLLIVVGLIALLRKDNVEISQSTGTIDGHEYVDLGLSVKWATCNVGASSPSDYGNYYAWGEVRTKSEYTEENSLTYKESMGDISGNSTYDAARYNWGGKWRLPTEAECRELVDNCWWFWGKYGGHKGYKATSKKNGASIFLPAAGRRYGSYLHFAGEDGYYWSSTPDESRTQDAYRLYSYSYHGVDCYPRYFGLSVRPVSE